MCFICVRISAEVWPPALLWMMKCSGSTRQEISDVIVTVTTAATPAGVTGRSGYRDTQGISGLCSDTTAGVRLVTGGRMWADCQWMALMRSCGSRGRGLQCHCWGTRDTTTDSLSPPLSAHTATDRYVNVLCTKTPPEKTICSHYLWSSASRFSPCQLDCNSLGTSKRPSGVQSGGESVTPVLVSWGGHHVASCPHHVPIMSHHVPAVYGYHRITGRHQPSPVSVL